MKTLCLRWILLLHMIRTNALRTCLDVQETLMACVFSSDLDSMAVTGQEDVTQLCWHTSVMLECVAEARDTCPTLPILANPDFARAIRTMEEEHGTHCQPQDTTPSPPILTTSTSMSNDQPSQCDPLAAMTRCNEHMTGVTPGDVRAMCKPGEAYLTCLEEVVDNCPGHAEHLPFDLEEAINTTRTLLQRECPAILAEFACADEIENAKRSCAYYLSNGDGDYCRSLQLYMECIGNTLATCPDHDLQTLLVNQYRHHCQNYNDKSNSCPDNISSAMMNCSAHMHGLESGDTATFCRKYERYLDCVDDLRQLCGNDTKFLTLLPAPFEQMRQQANTVCGPSGQVITTEPRRGTTYSPPTSG